MYKPIKIPSVKCTQKTFVETGNREVVLYFWEIAVRISAVLYRVESIHTNNTLQYWAYRRGYWNESVNNSWSSCHNTRRTLFRSSREFVRAHLAYRKVCVTIIHWWTQEPSFASVKGVFVSFPEQRKYHFWVIYWLVMRRRVSRFVI